MCFQNTENYLICAQRSHPPSKQSNKQKNRTRNTSSVFLFVGLLLLVLLYTLHSIYVSLYTFLRLHPLYTCFMFVIYLLLSMSSVLSSSMHYISFTFKQSLTALSNACSSAFNLFLCFIFTSTYSHRC